MLNIRFRFAANMNVRRTYVAAFTAAMIATTPESSTFSAVMATFAGLAIGGRRGAVSPTIVSHYIHTHALHFGREKD
jgi:hypothetical protein